MNKQTLQNWIALAGLALASATSMAQTAPAEPESTLSYNAGVVSEYRYRGISQSRFQPALQGGADYADKSGLYIGTWASTIKWIKDDGVGNGATGPIELDIYGGYKFPVGEATMDVGVLRYQYVNNTLSKNPLFKNADTTEVYAAATLGVFTAKYSYSLTNLFGQIPTATGNTKGSGYLDLSATLDLGDGYSLVPHAGHQAVSNMSVATYSDYNLAFNKDLGNGLVLSATAYNTNAKLGNYAVPSGLGSDSGKNLGKSALVLGAKYTF